MSPARLTSTLGQGPLSASASASPSPSPTSHQPSPRPTLSLDVRDPRAGATEKRLPSLPSPGRAASVKGWALGAYDNKLVSSTLSQLPPLPPLSPGGMSSTGSNISGFSGPSFSGMGQAHHLGTSPNYGASSLSLSSMHPPIPRTRTSSNPGAGILVLPDGTKLATSGDPLSQAPTNMHQTMAHSSPNSPWSLLTVHVLPVFAGSPLKTPLEDLNQLCNSHIMATSQRVPASRLVAVFTSDLREFIASGMLTLKAKFETLEEAKVVARAAEVWNFFWGQILPYVEGVFLPFSQVRDVPSTSSARTAAPPIVPSTPIPVRQILLSGFLLHILLPLLPRLIPLLSDYPGSYAAGGQRQPQQQRGATELPRLLQMSLVLATQAQYSAFFPVRDLAEAEARDEETREHVEELGRAVRWSMAVASGVVDEFGYTADERDVPLEYGGDEQTAVGDTTAAAARPGLKRGPSVSQAGRLRPRARTLINDEAANGSSQGQPQAQGQTYNARWGRPRIDEDDEDAESTLNTNGQMFARPTGTLGATLGAGGTISAATSVAPSTVRGGESLATITDQRTPVGAAPGPGAGGEYRRRHDRTYSSGESDLTTASSMLSWGAPRKK